MKNHIQKGEALTLTAPAALVSGQAFLVGAIFAVAKHDAAEGEEVSAMTEEVFALPKKAATALSQGDRAYWDATAKEITNVSEGNKLVGVVTEAAAADATTVAIKIVDDHASALPVAELTATASLNFASIAAAASEDKTVAVSGAAEGDAVQLGLAAAPTAGLIFQAFVSAADTVTVRATNITASPVDPAAASFRVTVTKA